MTGWSHPALRRIGVFAFGVVSSTLFLILVLRRADLAQAWEALLEASLWQVLLGSAVIQFVYLAQALRWRIVAGLSGRRRRYFALVVAGVGVNNVLPLRIGDLLRARWLAAGEGVPTGRAVGSVFRDRAADVVALVVVLVVTLPVVGGAVWADRLVAAGLVLLVALACVVAAALWYTRRRPRQRLPARSRPRTLVRDVLDELASALSRRRIGFALALSFAAWGIWAAAARLVCQSLGIDVTVVEVLFVTGVVNLGVAIPSSPGFVGTYQWLGVSALGVVGVAAEPALAFAIVMQGIWFVPTTIVGGALALREVRDDPIRRRRRTQSYPEPVGKDS